MKIVIFGGTFNPVHLEHVNIAAAAASQLGADKLIIIPTALTPNKGGKLTASGKDRLEMCRLAFKDIPNAEVSDMEISAGGVSYSYITCEKIAEQYPDAERYFIMGCDMLENFPQWKFPERILACTKVAACARVDGGRFAKAVESFESRFSQKVTKINYVGGEDSSTMCRVLSFCGESAERFTGRAVADYIAEKGIYYHPKFAEVKNFLTESRWRHTLRVAEMAAENCRRIGWNEEKALTAAVLHDCAKYLPLTSDYLKGFTPPEGVPEPVMHQFSGAYMAANYFKVDDEEILNAIKYHASGRENMSVGEMFIYLCDMLESGRKFDGVQTLREIFYRDIAECMYAALEHQMKYLNGTGEPVYYLTEKAYNYLKENK